VVKRPFIFGATAVGKTNRCTRCVKPPCGYAPLHFRRNQRSRRRTATQEAYNRPTVVCPLSFAAIGGPTWGPRPTCHATGALVTGCGKITPPLAPMPCPLGAAAEDWKDKFLEPVQRLEAPRAWPNSDIKGHGLVSHGNGRGNRRSHRRAGSNCINRRAGAAGKSPIRLWPHLQARTLP
jgi:hypothetical protein